MASALLMVLIRSLPVSWLPQSRDDTHAVVAVLADLHCHLDWI